jgi:hypothetical protein
MTKNSTATTTSTIKQDLNVCFNKKKIILDNCISVDSCAFFLAINY